MDTELSNGAKIGIVTAVGLGIAVVASLGLAGRADIVTQGEKPPTPSVCILALDSADDLMQLAQDGFYNLRDSAETNNRTAQARLDAEAAEIVLDMRSTRAIYDDQSASCRGESQ